MPATSLARPAYVILVGGAMFTFISYWRTAAVVLCDLASSAYYIGGIVEQEIGKAAPFFILAVLLFSYAVRAVYIESATLFVRGGVYRVVRAALGRFFAKIAVSALMFDYLLTGPISGVAAGQYLLGLGLQTAHVVNPELLAVVGLDQPAARDSFTDWGSVVFACLVTVYFYRMNLYGIFHSSDRAVKIMLATTVMTVIMLGWCLVTLAVRGPANQLVATPDLSPKFEPGPDGQPRPVIDPVTGEQADPLGFIPRWFPGLAEKLRHPAGWLSLIGLLGLAIAFGHSVLAMSGEETLAQVYREVEAPKLPNFQKAAFIIFIYSLILTGAISFFAVLLIPDEVRMRLYADNLISGLALSVIGPDWLRLLLSAFVVMVGVFILAGAVNTAIIGSNGVLNRVAEDGVLPDWFLRPHPQHGTSYRILRLIAGLQLAIIVLSGGNMLLLGEAYAFGVLWSFVFQAAAMVVLRFKDPRPREFRVPGNLRVGPVELPLGLLLILAVLVTTAGVNLLTKEVATVSGVTFTALFFGLFTFSEWHAARHRPAQELEHVEQFNEATAGDLTPAGMHLSKPYRRLVAIRTIHGLPVLEKALAETDPDSTDLIVVSAKVLPMGPLPSAGIHLNRFDQEFLTRVVQVAETAGKEVRPVVLPTNNAWDSILRLAASLQVQELMTGLSVKYSPQEQLGLMAYAWVSQHQGRVPPLTLRIVGPSLDLHSDLGGGHRIPPAAEQRARTVAELRTAGVGVSRVLLHHDGCADASDLFDAVLTMLDPVVELALAVPADRTGEVAADVEKARKVGRQVALLTLVDGDPAPGLAGLAREGKYDLLILPAVPGMDLAGLASQADCRVLAASSGHPDD